MPAPACAQCGKRDTPEWRRGPSGLLDLCNACGLRYGRSKRAAATAAVATAAAPVAITATAAAAADRRAKFFVEGFVVDSEEGLRYSIGKCIGGRTQRRRAVAPGEFAAFLTSGKEGSDAALEQARALHERARREAPAELALEEEEEEEDEEEECAGKRHRADEFPREKEAKKSRARCVVEEAAAEAERDVEMLALYDDITRRVTDELAAQTAKALAEERSTAKKDLAEEKAARAAAEEKIATLEAALAEKAIALVAAEKRLAEQAAEAAALTAEVDSKVQSMLALQKKCTGEIAVAEARVADLEAEKGRAEAGATSEREGWERARNAAAAALAESLESIQTTAAAEIEALSRVFPAASKPSAALGWTGPPLSAADASYSTLDFERLASELASSEEFIRAMACLSDRRAPCYDPSTPPVVFH